jgi:glycerol kinase
MGACYLAGLATGYWDSIEDIRKQWKAEKVFTPLASAEKILKLKEGWKDAVGRTLSGKEN